MTATKVEAGAAGHGAEPRGKRTEAGEATYLIAIAEALWEEMERDDRVFMLGEDIGVYGGAFKVTEGFIDRFGPQRVMDTPIAEDTIVGMAVGAVTFDDRLRQRQRLPGAFGGPAKGLGSVEHLVPPAGEEDRPQHVVDGPLVRAEHGHAGGDELA